jgi:hypothetical protein
MVTALQSLRLLLRSVRAPEGTAARSSKSSGCCPRRTSWPASVLTSQRHTPRRRSWATRHGESWGRGLSRDPKVAPPNSHRGADGRSSPGPFHRGPGRRMNTQCPTVSEEADSGTSVADRRSASLEDRGRPLALVTPPRVRARRQAPLAAPSAQRASTEHPPTR